jgi:hypothetical protein
VIAASSFWVLAVFSSRVHVEFSFRTGGWQGAGNDPVYQHTNTFDTFPFPPFSDLSQQLCDRLADLGEQLDTFRKARLVQHEHLTMTSLYNALERARQLENGCDVPPLSDAERQVHKMGGIAILRELHDDIDRAVLEAYGWVDLAPAVVGKPGATTPSLCKTPEQEAGEENILSRLVALNRDRAAEEARGRIRWLRPEFQIPKLSRRAPQSDAAQQTEAMLDMAAIAATKPAWPADGLDQIRALHNALARSDAPVSAKELSTWFKGGRKRDTRVREVLAHMVETGMVRQADAAAEPRFFVPG